MGKIKLSVREIDKIKEIEFRLENIRKDLSGIAFKELQLSIRKEELKEYHKKSIEMENTLAKELELRYGPGRVDLEKGILITPN